MASSVDFTQVLMNKMGDDIELKWNAYLIKEGQTDQRVFNRILTEETEFKHPVFITSMN